MAKTLRICPRHHITHPKGAPCPACRTRSPNWKRIAQTIRTRDGHCQHQGCTTRHPLEIHHLVPIHKGGTDHPANLISLCPEHHATVRSIN